jgi:hypothetical protein
MNLPGHRSYVEFLPMFLFDSFFLTDDHWPWVLQHAADRNFAHNLSTILYSEILLST